MFFFADKGQRNSFKPILPKTLYFASQLSLDFFFSHARAKEQKFWKCLQRVKRHWFTGKEFIYRIRFSLNNMNISKLDYFLINFKFSSKLFYVWEINENTMKSIDVTSLFHFQLINCFWETSLWKGKWIRFFIDEFSITPLCVSSSDLVLKNE